MSLLPGFGSSKHRTAEEALRQRITALQTELDNCRGMAKRSTELRHEVMRTVAVVFLGLGFALGVYREPILQTAGDLAANLGIYADAAHAAYRRDDLATTVTQGNALAGAGDARALALRCYRGHGVTRDYKEAVTWFRRAADQGDAVAQFYLGIMFADGQGVPQDRAEAAKWFRRAADRGTAEAQYNLGLAYATGEGVSLDNISAHMWFNLAAAGFPASDTNKRSAAVHNRGVVAGKMTPGQVAEAERLARTWNAVTDAKVAANGGVLG